MGTGLHLELVKTHMGVAITPRQIVLYGRLRNYLGGLG